MGIRGMVSWKTSDRQQHRPRLRGRGFFRPPADMECCRPAETTCLWATNQTVHHSSSFNLSVSGWYDTAVLHDCIMNCVVSCLYWILVCIRSVYRLLLLSCPFLKNNFWWVMNIGTVVDKFHFWCNKFIPTVRNTIKEVDECQESGAYSRITEKKKSIFILLFMVLTEILYFRYHLP